MASRYKISQDNLNYFIKNSIETREKMEELIIIERKNQDFFLKSYEDSKKTIFYFINGVTDSLLYNIGGIHNVLGDREASVWAKNIYRELYGKPLKDYFIITKKTVKNITLNFDDYIDYLYFSIFSILFTIDILNYKQRWDIYHYIEHLPIIIDDSPYLNHMIRFCYSKKNTLSGNTYRDIYFCQSHVGKEINYKNKAELFINKIKKIITAENLFKV